MPTYEVTAPDGAKYKVNAPEGASQEDAIKYVQENFYQAKTVEMPKPEKPVGKAFSEEIADIPRQLGLTGRAALEGGLGTLGLFTDPLARMVGLPSAEQGASSLADLIGLPKPETKIEKVAGSGAKMLAGGGGMLGLANRVAKVGGVTGEVGKLLAASPVQQLQAAAGAGTAGGYVQETGGDALGTGVAALAGGVATPLAVSGVRGIPQAAKGAVEFLAPGMTKQTAPQVDLVIQNVLKDSGLRMADIPVGVVNQIKADLAQALKVGDLDGQAVKRMIDYRLIGATPTRGTLTLDPALITRERNLAKMGINSADPKLQVLGNVQNQNNATLIQRLNDLGTTNQDQIGAAQSVIGKLSGLNDEAKSAIDAAYKQARGTAGREIDIDPNAFAQGLDDRLKQANLHRFLPNSVRGMVNDFADGSTPLNVNTAEQFKTIVRNLQRSAENGNVRMALGLVRESLDAAPPASGLGQQSIDAFNNARELNRQWMGVVDRVPALQAIRDGIEPDKFVDKFIIGSGEKSSVMDVAKLKHLIKDDPQSVSAIRGQMLNYLKSQALNGAADEVGNFSQSAFNKAINRLGERKLKLFFDKSEIEQIKAIGRVASYEQFQPRGSAVNNSNSGALMMSALFERLATLPLLSKIPMLPQMTGNISASFGARDALNASKALVKPQEAMNVGPYMLPAAAGMGLLSGN